MHSAGVRWTSARAIAMHLRTAAGAAAVGAVAFGTTSVPLTTQAQSATQASSTPRCVSCRLNADSVVSFGGSGSEELLSPGVSPARDSRGRYYAASIDRYQIVAITERGRFARSFGRRGEGPGEISAGGITHLVVGLADTLFAFQFGRVTVFDPSFGHVRTYRIPTGLITAVHSLHDGRFVVAASFRGPASFGFPFHILSKDGEIVHSFGDGKLAAYMGEPDVAARRENPPPLFALSADRKTIWTAPGYHIRQLAIDGSTLQATDVAGSAWFPSRRDSVGTDRTGKAFPMKVGGGHIEVGGIDRQGLLWLNGVRPVAGRPIAQWARGVDVFDPTTNAVLASAPDAPAFRFFNSDMAWTLREDDDGVVTFTVWQVRVSR